MIFYRDGVSEGEFAQVVRHEIPRIKGAEHGTSIVLRCQIRYSQCGCVQPRGVQRAQDPTDDDPEVTLHRGRQEVWRLLVMPLWCVC